VPDDFKGKYRVEAVVQSLGPFQFNPQEEVWHTIS
jgi:hypothetical protein